MKIFIMGMLFCAATTPTIAGKPTPPTPPPAPINYDVTWVITPGQNDRTTIYDVNGQGTTAVGSQYVDGISQAISIDVATGNVTDLNTVLTGIPEGWRLTTAKGITNLGRIAGEATDGSGNRVLYVYDAADPTPFKPVGMGIGNHVRYRDMNEMGDLLFAEFSSSNSYLFTHDGQEIKLPVSLMTAGQFFTAGPAAINNDRVGAGNTGGDSFTTAYVHDINDGTTTSIAKYFQSREINNAGTVVGRGSLSTKGNPTLTAMKYENGVKTPLSNVSSEASDINDAGQVTGRINSTNNRSIPTAFLYDPTQGFWSLNDLIQDTAEDELYWNCVSGFDLSTSVEAMSEPLSSGYPVMIGHRTVLGSVFPDGVDRQLGFILTPISPAMSSALVAASVPEPSSCLLVTMALLSLNAARRRRQVNSLARR
jgi:hypothetical protein